MNDWISVKDRLPIEKEIVLAIGWDEVITKKFNIAPDGRVNINEILFFNGKFHWYDFCYGQWEPWNIQPTHWMRKPKPPRKVEPEEGDVK